MENKPEVQKQEILYDESVCSPEFAEGCTTPVSEQEEG